MEFTWQELAVGIVGLLVAVRIVMRLRRSMRRGYPGACASCSETSCPLRGRKERKKR